MNMHTVVGQKWEESEKGWGTRPDGHSIHLSEQHRQQYIKEYWDRMPNAVPDEYSRPCTNPYPIDIDEETYQKLILKGGNLRY